MCVCYIVGEEVIFGLYYFWIENDVYLVLIYIKFLGKKLDDGKGIGGRDRLIVVRIDVM